MSTSSAWKVVIVLSSGGIFGDRSVKCSKRTVTGVCFVSSLGWTTQLGPVRVCLGKERGRKKDREGVREDAPMSPLHIRNQGLIWNQTQTQSQGRKRECLKKKRITGRGEKCCPERVNFYWTSAPNLLAFRCCVACWSSQAQSFTTQTSAGKVGCEATKGFKKKRNTPRPPS